MEPPPSFWSDVYPPIARIARRFARSAAEAEDLAQQAFELAFARLRAPEDPRAFVLLAAGIVRHLAMNGRRNDHRRREDGWRRTAANAFGGVRRTPEELTAARERAVRVLDVLARRLAGDETARAILDRILVGEETPAQWQASMGCDIETIRNARRRLARHVATLAAADGRVDPGAGWDVDAGDDDPAREAMDP